MGHLSPQELGNRAFRVVGEDVGQSVGSIEVADSDRRVDDIGKAEATSWARGSPPASAPSIARVAASRPVSNSPAHAAAVFAGRCASVEPVACCGLRPFPYGGVRAWCYNLVQSCAGLSVSLGGDAIEAGRNADEDQSQVTTRHRSSRVAVVAVALSGAALLVPGTGTAFATPTAAHTCGRHDPDPAEGPGCGGPRAGEHQGQGLGLVGDGRQLSTRRVHRDERHDDTWHGRRLQRRARGRHGSQVGRCRRDLRHDHRRAASGQVRRRQLFLHGDGTT